MPAPTTLIVLAVVPDGDRYLVVEERDGALYLPAGRVDRGENLMAAIVRETAEEAGVLIGLTGILGFDQDWAPDGSATRLRFVFVGYQGIAGPPKTTPDRHSRGAAWLTKAELAARRLRDPEVLTWIERYESHATLLPCASYRPRGGGAP
ncbi:MAG: NUDIX domain-containing protein [Deltaproteobacteria bacterium]|jgi:8-oxo-dGTP pyrophosphatase MutT (NUDIX family)